MASLEPLPVFTAYIKDELEPFDRELLCLIASDDDDDNATPMEEDDCNTKVVDDFAPLNPSSTPTGVDAFDPGFSNLEVEDLMNLLVPEHARVALSRSQSCPTPTKKIGKRTKKCTYAARRREVAFLRKETMALEKRLNDLRSRCEASSLEREQAAMEKSGLAATQAENARLRAMVSSQEAKIRRADAYMSSVIH
ncbi:hypothetical protein BBJ28_00000600 [Nothophytophthora sp. Chile5]|nr:hypothetical protein BBJ28_00000600 [Nothophytophthora sp. Chile5]